MTTPSSNESRGQALVEFALTLFIFLFVVAAVFEAGRFTVTYADLTYAVREGGRSAALPPPVTTTTEDVCAATAAAATVIAIPCGNVSIDAGGDFAERTTGDRVTVTVRYVFTPIIAALFGDRTSVTLRRSATFTVE